MISDDLHKHLIKAAESYCRIKRISMITLSLKVLRSGGVFERLDSGGSLTVRNYGRLMDFFEREGHKVPPLVIGGWSGEGVTRGARRRNQKAETAAIQ